MLTNVRLSSALLGTFFISLFPHQEPRFLLPAVPLLLSCLRLPSSGRWKQNFWTSWAIFNLVMGMLMGVYHQGGIIPTQIEIPKVVNKDYVVDVQVFWWKTYPPPTYLLGSDHINAASNMALTIDTVPLVDKNAAEVLTELQEAIAKSKWPQMTCEQTPQNSQGEIQTQYDSRASAIYVVLPLSAHMLNVALSPRGLAEYEALQSTTYHLFQPTTSASTPETDPDSALILTRRYSYKKHISLDDVDFGDDGVAGTISRVVGRRGLGVFEVQRLCSSGLEVVKHDGRWYLGEDLYATSTRQVGGSGAFDQHGTAWRYGYSDSPGGEL